MTLQLPITLPPWCPCAPTSGRCEGKSLQTSGSSARARKLEDTASSWVAGIHFLCHLLVCCQAVSVSVFERGKCSGARHFRRNVPLNNPRRKMCKVHLRSPRDPQEGLELKNPGEPQIYEFMTEIITNMKKFTSNCLAVINAAHKLSSKRIEERVPRISLKSEIGR